MGLEGIAADPSLLLPQSPRGGLVLRSQEIVESPPCPFLTSRQRTQRSPYPLSEPMAFRIFVGNLSLEVRDTELRELFAAHGDIADCRVIFSRETGESRGFAFLEFKKEDEGQTALRELNDKDFHGRPLRLKEATPAGGDGGSRPRPGGAGGPGRGGDSRGPSRGPSRGAGPGGGGGGFGQKEDSRKGSQRKPKDGGPGDKNRQSAGPGQGRPAEKDRGGSRNRFNFAYDDDDDEDFQLFERDDEDLDYDPELLARLNADPEEDEEEEDLERE